MTRQPAWSPSLPTRWGNASIYDTRIAHVRHTPTKNAFTYRSYSWLVDLDHLPEPPRPLRALAQFRAQTSVALARIQKVENIIYADVDTPAPAPGPQKAKKPAKTKA